MKYSIDQIKKLAACLQDAPSLDKNRPSHSKQEVVTMLKTQIAQLRSNGYTFEEIAEFFRRNEIEITSHTLKNYIQRAKATASLGDKAGTKKKRDTESKSNKPQEAKPSHTAPPHHECSRNHET